MAHPNRLPGLLIAMLVFGGLSMQAAAEEREIQPGDIDPAQIVLTHPDMPSRGMTKAQVEERLGEPGNRVPPVGDPPISSWFYDDFIVYFEHDRVLHSVIPGGRRYSGDS